MTSERGSGRLLGPLGVRLAVAFVGVALLAVAVLTTLVIVTTTRETSSLAASERDAAAASAARALAAAYAAADRWGDADLAPARDVAERAGARLVVRDASGAIVAGPGPGSGRGGGGGAPGGAAVSSAPVEVDGEVVGSAQLRVPGSGLSRAEQRLRDRLVSVALLGAGLAAAVALVVAVLIARRLTRPLDRLALAAGRLAAGDASARAGIADAPGELGAVGRAFDEMAGALDSRDAARRALLADLAHELRTPLTILRADCEALVDGVEPAVPERLAALHDEILRLERLVSDLETLAAAESAFLRLETAPVDLAAVGAAACARMGARAAAEGIALVTRLEPALARGDPRRLDQVADNLLTNALKFTPPGGRVTVSTTRRGDDAVLAVRDTGRGIPADELPHVFERFWRGGTSADVSGRGIGLAVVRELVDAHHGRVTASSPPGGGTLMEVVLPAA